MTVQISDKNEEQSVNNTTVYVTSGNNEAKQEEGKNTQYIATLIASLSAFAMGLCLSWSSSAIPMLQAAGSHPRITDSQGSWIASLLPLGAVFGALPAGYLAARMGPKRLLQFLAFPLFGSWIIIAYCGTVYGLYIARFLSGLGIGAISVATPMYVAELAEPKIRGTLGTFFQLQITLGLLSEYILGGSVADFRILALISSIVPVVFLVCFTFMPESPIYLTYRGNFDQAKASLQWFRGSERAVDAELAQIKAAMTERNISQGQSSKDRILMLSSCKKALIIALAMMVFQQLSGINAVLFFAQDIFRESGGMVSPSTGAIALGLVQVIATYAATLLIDRAGRRVLLLISSGVMSLCLTVLTVSMMYKDTGTSSPPQDDMLYSFLPTCALATYVVAFSMGFGPIPWILMAEIFSAGVKAPATAIAAAFNWFLAFGVTKCFAGTMAAVGSAGTFGSFGAICFIGMIFVYFVVPETKGKTIEEIVAMLGGTENKLEENNTVKFSDIKLTVE